VQETAIPLDGDDAMGSSVPEASRLFGGLRLKVFSGIDLQQAETYSEMKTFLLARWTL